MNNNVPAMCSICCEEKIPVAMCSRCNQADKRVCEQCAVRLYDGCSNAHCNCFGFKCPYCRAVVKTSREWTKSSAVYWEAYAAMRFFVGVVVGTMIAVAVIHYSTRNHIDKYSKSIASRMFYAKKTSP